MLIELLGTKRIALYPQGAALLDRDLRAAVPGAYKNAQGIWTFPLSVETWQLLRHHFGDITVGKALLAWSKRAQSARKSMARTAKAKSARLVVLPKAAPKLYRAMRTRPYQLAGVRYVADTTAALLADEPGLGKTLIALGAMLEAEIPGPYLVVAPKTAAESVWRREIARWLPTPHQAITMPETRLQRERTLRQTRLRPTTWVIVNPEMLQIQEWLICSQCGKRTPATRRTQNLLNCGHPKVLRTKVQQKNGKQRVKLLKAQKHVRYSYPWIHSVEWGAIIVDESHEVLIRRSGVPTQRRRGLTELRSRESGIRLAMSGTPFDSKPELLWGTLNWLMPNVYSAFHRWAELYWAKGGYTGFEIGEFRRDREELLWDSLSDVALRRTKLEVAKDLPPKIHVGTPLDNTPNAPIGVWLEMTGKQLRAYTEIEKLSVTHLRSGRLEAFDALTELTRLKQLACCYGDVRKHPRKLWEYTPTLPSNKFEWLIEHLEEWGYPNTPLSKVVVVSFYTGILGAFQRGIERHFKSKPRKPLCTAITGRTPQSDRHVIIDRFNDPNASPHIMFLNVKAGGTAITLDTADRMVFISETRNPAQQEQAEDRIHRVSAPRQCLYYYLRSLGTVDVGTALVNAQQEQVAKRLLDGRRGIEYVRHVLDLSRD